MKKKALCLLLCLALCCALVPAAAAEDGGVGIDSFNFPDPVFRAYVQDHFDADRDGVLSRNELGRITTVDVTDYDVASLKGIEHFEALCFLYCTQREGGRISSLDLSGNPCLLELGCANNRLTELDLSGCPELSSLWCDGNQLKELDVSLQHSLSTLNCSGNQIRSLDLSANPELSSLWCADNGFGSLDVSANPELQLLWCSGNKLKELDLSRNTKLGVLCCDDNLIRELDVSGNSRLFQLWCDGNRFSSLDVTHNAALKELTCNNNALTELDLSKNPALTELSCAQCRLTELNLRRNTALRTLQCFDNPLTALDLSKNRALETLGCSDCALRELDLRNTRLLKSLNCSRNKLSALDLAANTRLEQLSCRGNRLLTLDLSKLTLLKECSVSGNSLLELNLSGSAALDALDCGSNSLSRVFVHAKAPLSSLKTDAGVELVTGKPAFLPTPQLKTAVNDRKGVLIEWGAVRGAETYRIYRIDESGSWVQLSETAETSYVDRGAKSGVSYRYTVRCVGADGKLSDLDPVGRSVRYLALPLLRNISRSKEGVRLSWYASGGAELYGVYRRAEKGAWELVGVTELTSYLDDTVKNEIKYYYSVCCVDADGRTQTSAFDDEGKAVGGGSAS